MAGKKRTHEQYEQKLFEKEIDYWPIEKYMGSMTHILHECLNGHQWKSAPRHILYGKGCPECARLFMQKTHATYVAELEELNNEIKVLEEYTGALTSILHECTNGHQWRARPSCILTGRGCPKCHSFNKTKTTNEYKKELTDRSIDFQLIEEYITAKTPTLHQCINGHIWKAIPDGILRGRGCPSCAPTGFNPDLPGTLYYIKIEKFPESFYKIGITNNTISKRFEKDRDKTITVLLEKHFEKGSDASKEEKEILQKYKSFRQNAPGFLKSGGNTELFEEDILGLDK